MKKLVYLIFLLITIPFILSACSDSDGEHRYVDFTILDFGEGVYRPNPFPFLDNIPPFSWMGLPDSVKRETELEVIFNEDALRSNSSGQLTFIDSKGDKVKGIMIGNSSGQFIIDTTLNYTVVPVSFTVDPVVRDSILKGSIVIVGDNLDQVNDAKLNSMATPIASWQLTHKIGVNWLRWIIFIFIIIVLVYFLFLILKVIIAATVSLFTLIIPSHLSLRRNSNRLEKREEKQKKRNPFIVKCERILLSEASVSDKAVTLERLFVYWDYELPEEDKNFEASMLNSKVMEAMEGMWSKYYKYTKNNTSWSGIVLDSTLIPRSEVTPPNKNYSNMDNLTWGEIMKKYNFKGLEYKKGKPNFSKLAVYSVQIPNFVDLVTIGKDNDRGPLQEEAFRILAQRLHKSIEEVRSYKEKNRLVWHEDTDCKTLYLVPQEIHNNFHHLGGIGILRILRSSQII